MIERLYWGAQGRQRPGVPFTITIDDVRNAYPADGRCPVLGIRLKLRDRDASPSLDRINNAWGYEPGNIAVMSQRANRLKNDGNAAEHEAIAAWMRGKGLT